MYEDGAETCRQKNRGIVIVAEPAAAITIPAAAAEANESHPRKRENEMKRGHQTWNGNSDKATKTVSPSL